MPHACKNLLIRCMDFRLRGELMCWIEESGLFEGGFDVVSLAGASKSLADGNDEVKKFFMEQIDIAVRLHNINRIVILHHSDCGAYRQNYSFQSKEAEKARQVEDMNKAKEAILEKYPDLEIIFVWGDMQNEYGSKINFEVV